MSTEVLDTTALEARLRRHVRGEVRFDHATRAAYAHDASNYREMPVAVVVPADVEDVVGAVGVCHDAGAPLVSRGGGTSLAGQTCNTAVVLDFSKYVNRIVEIDPDRRLARVQPGVVLDDLRHAAEEHGLTFGPDPATHNRCTLGGMIGNNSCGVHSVMAGRTADNVAELDVLTYDGLRLRVGPTSDEELQRIITAGGRRADIYQGLQHLVDRDAAEIRRRFPEMPRLVSGYGLDHLLPERQRHVARALVGTEGTCVTVLEATCHLVDSPAASALVVLGYPDVFTAADAVPGIREHGVNGLEGLDEYLLRNLRRKNLHRSQQELFPEGGGWLLAEVGGSSPDEAAHHARRLVDAVGGGANTRIFTDPRQQEAIWAVRESGLGATAQVPGQPEAWPGWEDSAVPPGQLGAYLRELKALYDDYGYEGAFYGHFGDGCLHVRTTFDLVTAEGVGRFRSFLQDAAQLVLRHGGSLSGEHGDGQARGELLDDMYGDRIVGAFREFKSLWDPGWKMNPGKVIDADPITANLKLGPDYRPWEPDTVFAFPDDGGSLSRATLRCVGVGECRKTEGGTMCPSYMATREEIHSTRGRARVLHEMLVGGVPDGWRDEGVHEALDLCLACKACKNECPVNVDMATYKAEFFSHHYRRRLRPRPAYALGLIPWWARLASRAPRLVNAVTSQPRLAALLKRAGHIAPARELPRFARQTLRAWFEGRARADRGTQVVLWPDTFTNHLEPDVGRAAVEVLEAAGRRVILPPPGLCCGRPLYDFGMLTLAKRQLRMILDALSPALEAGLPIVVLEPSCLAVFRDELGSLFPNDAHAERLQRSAVSLAELLAADGYEPAHRSGRALFQGHCHQEAVIGTSADIDLLERAGLDPVDLDAGCCGMAGSFGYEQNKYDVSIACAERVLAPAVRSAADDDVVVADGFSCRTQVGHTTGRRALHLSQVLRDGLHADDGA